MTYEEVYLKAYDSVREARESIGRYLAFYNTGRPHSRLDSQTPDEVYSRTLPVDRTKISENRTELDDIKNDFSPARKISRRGHPTPPHYFAWRQTAAR